MVWLAIYNNQLFDTSCILHHIHYASDVDNKSKCGVRDIYVKCVYYTYDEKSDEYVEGESEVEACIGRNTKGTYNVLKRRYRGAAYKSIVDEYTIYRRMMNDLDRYRNYVAVLPRLRHYDIPFSIETALINAFDTVLTIFNERNTGPLYHDWEGSIYGYLTPFDCRAISYFLSVYPDEVDGAGFIISKRVYKFFRKCTPTNRQFWYVAR